MRLMLAEDSLLLREGLSALLTEEGHNVLAAVGDGDALLAAVEREQPDVAVLDVRMPPTHTDEGMRAALRVRKQWPGVGVLVLSQYVERRYTTELITGTGSSTGGGTGGGVGYLLKDRVAHVGDFLDALTRVASGGTALDPEVVRQLLAHTGRSSSLSHLTPREGDVLQLLAQGHTNAAVATRLHVSSSAVEKHVNAIFDKLGLIDTEGYNRRILAVLRYLES